MSRPEKITEPTAISFGITIAVPMHSLFFRTIKNDIYECEKNIINEREHTADANEKKNFDRCRAVVQWAIACGASLVTAEHTVFNTIDFSFSFDNFDAMLKFKEEFSTRIDNFMIF